MPQTIERGNPITLDAVYRDNDGDPADATNPTVSIIDSTGITVVNLVAPTSHPDVGQYQYVYNVADDAPLGAWAAVWYGEVDGDELGPVQDGFTVVRAGALSGPAASGGMVCSPWVTEPSCDVGDLSDEDIALLCEAASEVLWALSGRRYGVCTATIRPCRRDLVPGGWHEWGHGWEPVLYNGEWLNVCGHFGGCGCTVADEVLLPRGPLASTGAITVTIDGASFTDYRVDNVGGRFVLVRTDGLSWPACQDLALEATEPGTWAITWPFGLTIPSIGVLAVDELVCEFVKAKREQECKLPSRITQLVRQGETITLLDSKEFLSEGRLGLDFCDLFLTTVNPESLPSRSRVINPDDFAERRPVGT